MSILVESAESTAARWAERGYELSTVVAIVVDAAEQYGRTGSDFWRTRVMVTGAALTLHRERLGSGAGS